MRASNYTLSGLLAALECALLQIEVGQDSNTFSSVASAFLCGAIAVKVNLVPSTVCCNLVSLPGLTVDVERDLNLRAYVGPWLTVLAQRDPNLYIAVAAGTRDG